MFNTKKRYFKKRLGGIKKMLWDREFKKFKLLELREEVRKEYDKGLETTDAYKKQIANKDNTKETTKILEEKLAEMEKYTAKKEEQLKMFDAQISGGDSEENASVQAEIDGLHELDKMTREYIKTL